MFDLLCLQNFIRLLVSVQFLLCIPHKEKSLFPYELSDVICQRAWRLQPEFRHSQGCSWPLSPSLPWPPEDKTSNVDLLTFNKLWIDCNVKLLTHVHHHHLPPWIRLFDQFRHRRVAIVSWGVRDPFFPGVCRWGRISGVWCCPFFRGGWPSFICIWVSRLVFQRSLILVLCLGFLFCPVLCVL